jgi:two-component system sensor histidine kinase/response regulator
VLSSAGHLMQLTETIETGIARVLTKPVKQSDLFLAIQRTFSATGSNGTADDSGERIQCQVRPLRLLLAEDGRVNQLVATKLLQDRGHIITLATNGKEVLALLAQQDFDAVLMDIQMPVMNGFEATAIIRERERDTACHIPIIAMTANAMQGDRERCLAAGMDDYISKPVRSAELFRAVEECAGNGSPEPAPGSSMEADAEKVFDEEHFRRTIGDMALMKQLLEIFPEDTEGFLKEADAAITARDVAALYRTAHSLKGMIGNYAAPRAMEAFRATCDHSQNGRLDEAIACFEQARSEICRLAPELKKLRESL